MSSEVNPSAPSQEIKLPHVDESWSNTLLQFSKIKHHWTINDFILQEGTIYSSSFPIVDDNYLKWRLKMNTRFIPTSSTLYDLDDELKVLEYVSIWLNVLEGNTDGIKVKGKFSILDSKKNEKQSMQFEVNLTGKYLFGFERYLSRDFLSHNAEKYLPEGKLTVVCEMIVYGKPYTSSGPLTTKGPDCSFCNELFEEPNFTDAVVSASGKEFKVHKFILATRSPVFAAMFEHPMKEKKTGRVEINDIKPEVMQEVLRFIYTRKVMNLDNLAEDLLAAANKYGLNGLKIMCEEALFQKLSVKNAAKILTLADLHSCSDLKTKVIRFIANHATEIQNPDGRSSTEFPKPNLLAVVFKTLNNIIFRVAETLFFIFVFFFTCLVFSFYFGSERAKV